MKAPRAVVGSARLRRRCWRQRDIGCMAVLLSRGGCAVGAVWFFGRRLSRYASCVTVGSEVFWFAEAVLSGRGSEGQRHMPEGGQKRERLGQMQHHAAPVSYTHL